MVETQHRPAPDEDIIWGAASIAKVLNCPERRVYHLAAIKAIPVEKAGNLLWTRMSWLRRKFGESEATA